MSIILNILPLFLMSFVFYNTTTTLNINLREFIQPIYLSLYLMIIYIFSLYRNYILIPVILTSIILSFKIIEHHPNYRFSIDNSNYQLLFFGLLQCNLIYNILMKTLTVAEIIILNFFY